jgi:hypothetical protein
VRIGRRWLYLAAGIVVYALAGFFLAPWLVERTLVSTLKERLALDTTLDDLRINPFTFTLTVDGFRATPADGPSVLAFDRLFVNFELSSLFRWAWRFDELHLIRPEMHLERLGETDTNLSRLADTWAAMSPSQPQEPEQTPEPDDAGGPVRLMVADLQIINGSVTLTDRYREEPFETEFAPINLVVTDLSTLPDSRGQQRVTIRTESGAELAWTGTLAVNPLSVTGSVTLTGSYTPLLFDYFHDQLGYPIGLAGGHLDGRLDYSVGMDEADKLSVHIDDLGGTLSDVAITQPDHPNLLEIGAISVSGGSLAWPEQVVHIDDIHLDRVHIDAYRAADGSYLPSPRAPAASTPPDDQAPTEVAAEAAADADNPDGTGAPPAPEAPAGTDNAPTWSLTADTLRLTGWMIDHTDTSLENGQVGISNLNLTLEALSNAPGQSMPLHLDLTPTLGGRISLDGSVTVLPEPLLNAELSAEDVPLAIGQPYLDTVAHVGISDGRVGLHGILTSGRETPVRYEGDFRVVDLELTDRVQDERLVAWKELAIDRLAASPSALELSILSLDSPYARIEVEQGGRTNLDQLVTTRDHAPAPDTSQEGDGKGNDTAEDGEPFVLAIGETRIKDGSARFQDRNLPLPFEADVTALTGSLSTLASNSSAAARVAIEGQVNEYGRLKIDGSLQPFSPTRGTDVDVAFSNVELPRMSPYTIKFAGRRIADGRTDLTLSYRMVDGQLEGDNHLVIRSLRLGEKVPSPGAMNLPLDLAVALLKDPSGVVDFSFPVSGSLNDPQFSFSDAIMKAFSNVILGFATAPFRLLGSLVGVAPSEFESIAFEAGRADLTPPQREVLTKLADALTQRPQLNLSLTPVSDPVADRMALKKALVEAQIEAGLATDKDTNAQLPERRRKHLEALYDAAGLKPPKSEVRALASSPDADGKPVLDALAYAERLRDALIAATDIPDADLDALATQRAEAVSSALVDAVNLDVHRITILPPAEEEADKDDLVRMPLEVSARGR